MKKWLEADGGEVNVGDTDSKDISEVDIYSNLSFGEESENYS